MTKPKKETATETVSKTDRKRFMQMAVDLAEQALDAGKGGPFGAILVRGTHIVGSSGNCVFKHTDPTAHAEIFAGVKEFFSVMDQASKATPPFNPIYGELGCITLIGVGFYFIYKGRQKKTIK